MKIIISKKDISDVLNVVCEITDTTIGHHAFSSVLLSVQNDTIAVKATDSNIVFETQLKIDELTEGSILVNADKLFSVIRNIPDEKVVIEEIENNQVKIYPNNSDSENLEFVMFCHEAETFPEVVTAPPNEYIMYNQDSIKTMINNVLFAVSRDESRYNINGIFLKCDEKEISMVATDSKRLALVKFESNDINNESLKKGIVISTKTMNLIEKYLTGEGQVGIQIIENHIFISFNNYYISSALIPDEYPNYERVIPDMQQYTLEINKKELSDALRQVSLFCEKNNKIIFNIFENGIKITSDQAEVGKAKVTVPCAYHGSPIKIALNNNFIIEPLRVINEDVIHIGFTENNRAISLYPNNNDKVMHVIMPMQLD